MARILSLFLLIGTSLSLFAQLPPQTPAPLHRHMVEVNAQWLVQPAIPAEENVVVHFPNEAARIATHLHLVRERLLSRTPEGLSAAQMEARMDLLDDLQRYADAGTFPQNHVLPYRNPVFIDPVGTACAVGQLMIESGDRALAERISHEMNLAYVHEMDRPEVGTWATDNGFSGDELAWIQPGYPPQTVWSDMDGGADSSVYSLLVNTQGDLVLGGAFASAGGNAAMSVATWDGTQYSALGAGLDGTVHAMVEHNGKLYAGGIFNTGTDDLAILDNGVWTYQNVMQGMSPVIHDLHVMNNVLYASGEASGFAGTTHSVMQEQGGQWSQVGDLFYGSVLTLADNNGNLVAGGLFTELGQFGGTPCERVAELVNGAWQQLGPGLDAPVYALYDHDNVLFAGGLIFDGMNAGFGLAYYAPGSGLWMMPAFGNGSSLGNSSNPTSEVVGFAEHNGDLFLCGNFSVYGPWWNSDGSHVAQYIDSTQDVAGVAWMGGDGVWSMASHNGQLVLGGDLDYVNSTLCSNLASSNLFLGLADRTGVDHGITLSPVPAQDNLTVTFTKELPQGSTIEVVDVSGRTVIPSRTATMEKDVLDVRGLAPGSYFLRVSMQPTVGSIGFVKH